MSSTAPVKFNVIEKTLEKSFQEHFPFYKNGLSKDEYGGFVLTPEYGENAEILRNFKPRADDVWVVTFPKCGTTWTQELVWMVANDCDKERGKRQLVERSPFLEFPYLTPEDSTQTITKLHSLEKIDNMPSPRIIKTHLPLYLLHPELLDTCKVVYVARNPKDVIVSFFHHHKLIKIHEFTGNIDEFAQYFMDNEVQFAPFFPHILEAWKQKTHPNMLFLFYEDMKKDLIGQVEKVASFLGKKLTREQLEDLTEHLKFENFSKNEAVNYEVGKKTGFMNEDGRFCRKGQTGDWKNYFSEELNHHIDEWIAENLKHTDLTFVTEL